MNRRHFVTAAVAASAAATLLHPATGSTAPAQNGAHVRNFHPDMAYRLLGKTGVQVSALGFGMLRLPLRADGTTVDAGQTIAMLRHAIDCGLNYVDTASVYLGGQSEEVTGRALCGGYRDRVHLATKLPLRLMRSEADCLAMFDASRRRLQTDVVDFYLLHHITRKTWREAVVPYRVLDTLERLQAQGLIRHIGFSFHDSLVVLKRVLDAYPNWSFFQSMQNYLDTEYEAGILGMRYAWERGLGINCMQPLKAGILARPPQPVQAVLDAAPVRRTPVEWAFSYLWSMPEPGVVISGMHSMAEVEENLSYARRAAVGMLDRQDRLVLGQAALACRTMEGVSACTGCNYCAAACPKEVAIGCLLGEVWFTYKITGNKNAARRQYARIPSPRGVNADACNGCGACLPACPLQINIPELLQQMRSELGADPVSSARS